MPRSAYWQQQCPCGSSRRAIVSVTLSASTIGVAPRRKSRSRTVYLCEDCLSEGRNRKLELATIGAVIDAARGAFNGE